MTDNTNVSAKELKKEQIRVLVSSLYDMQKERIGLGNRLVQSYYISLGVKKPNSVDDPNAKTPQGDKANSDEGEKLLQVLKKEYEKITDGMLENNATVKATIKKMNSDNKLQYVRDESTFQLIDAYMKMLSAETTMNKVLTKYVQDHPLWAKFFEPIKGCGALMAANCIAYFDIYKAKYVSSLYRYAGLDTVEDKDKDGNILYRGKDAEGNILPTKLREQFGADGNAHYYSVEDGTEWTGDVVISQHGRSRSDVENQTYLDKDGVEQTKKGLTYNPTLKTKLVGVLSGCLLKAKDPTYAPIYYDYKARLDNNPKTKDYSSGHKDRMAQRYMIKQFLRNLYVEWRKLEGLEVHDSYEVDKLGMKPHKYNEYQHNVALGLC